MGLGDTGQRNERFQAPELVRIQPISWEIGGFLTFTQCPAMLAGPRSDPRDHAVLSAQVQVALRHRKQLHAIRGGISDHGRFRTFLLTALRRFVVNEWKHEGAAKRGGGIRHLTLDSGRVDQLLAAKVARDLTPDRLFERHWALVVLKRAFQELEAEQRAAGKAVIFEAVAPCLTGGTSTSGYDELADRLQSTPASLRMAVSRLRNRLGELIREEIRKTVRNDADVDDELGNLFRALQA